VGDANVAVASTSLEYYSSLQRLQVHVGSP